MEELFLPVLSHFQNGNGWITSADRPRYQVTPEEEKLTVQVWQGPWCYALSRVEDTAEFPLSEGGLAALRAWLEQWAEEMNGRPRESLAETIARRDALLQEQSAQAAE